MTITEKLAQRMTAALQVKKTALQNLADISKQSAVAHNKIVAENMDEDKRDTLLDGCMATVNFANSSVEAGKLT